MRILIFFTFITSYLLAATSLYASEEALDAIPIPPNSERRIAVINILQNGRRLSIANLTSDASLDEVLGFYKAQWSEPLGENLPGFIVDTAGDWTIISRPTEQWHQVVQLRETESGLAGRISVMELTEKVQKTPVLPMPGNASLFSTTSASDIGTSTTTYTVISKGGVRSMADFYQNHFESEGWANSRSQELGNSRIMLLRKRGARVEIVVSRGGDGTTVAIINQVADHG